MPTPSLLPAAAAAALTPARLRARRVLTWMRAHRMLAALLILLTVDVLWQFGGAAAAQAQTAAEGGESGSAFLDAFDPRAVFSSIDRQGRYAYGAQPQIALWNLNRLAETLLPHLATEPNDAVAAATAALEGFAPAFDAEGFVALVARIAGQRPGDPSVWAPEFRREIEDAVTRAVEIRPEHRLVVVEGNYLLLDEHPWRNLAGFFDTAWVLTPDESTRRTRLVERHERYGRNTEDARAHALGSDETNARRIEHNMVARAGLTVLEVDPG